MPVIYHIETPLLWLRFTFSFILFTQSAVMVNQDGCFILISASTKPILIDGNKFNSSKYAKICDRTENSDGDIGLFIYINSTLVVFKSYNLALLPMIC